MLTLHDDTAHIFAGLVGSGSDATAGPDSENTWGTAAPPADEGRCVPHRDSTASRSSPQLCMPILMHSAVASS